MALEGNLTAFGLSEILQLVAVQQKTGMLTVSGHEADAVMFFRDGAIVSARDRRRRGPDPFRDYLIRYGVLSSADIAKVTDVCNRSKLDLLDVIASEGLLTEGELSSHFHKQILETLHGVLTWEQCTYKFIPRDDIVHGIRTVGEFNIEAMLMECMRRIDEFPRLLEMFPGQDALVTRTAPETGSDAGDDFSANEKAVFEQLQSILSLRDLIARAKMPVFEVYETLRSLKEKGLIKTQGETRPAASDKPHTKTRPVSPRRNVIPFSFAVALFSLSCLVGVFTGAPLQFSSPSKAALNVPGAYHRTEETLRWRLEMYRARTGAYPPSLGALLDDGLLDEDTLENARALGLRYQLTPGRRAYTLR